MAKPRPVDENDPESEDKKILQEAKDNFKRWEDWEADFRSRYISDVKFANADPDNGWQWPQDLRADREANKRPALTINKTQRLVAMITNDASENKPAITIKPTGNLSSYKSAQVYEGLVRDIEYKSAAQNIYDDCSVSQVESGIAYFRVITKFVDDNDPQLDISAFNQEIRIEPVRDHLGVFLDCDIKQKDGSDALWGGVFDDMPRDEFEKLNPDVDMQEVGNSTLFGETDTWVKEDSIRIAEYYRIVQEPDEIYWVEDDQGKSEVFRASEAPRGFRDTLVVGKYKKRKTINRRLEWYKIAGHKIVERKKLKGMYIPIVRVVGVERIIGGKLERKGYVRQIKDPQRMFNFNASQEVEGVALQTKTPWVGPAAAFEGNEVAWNNANRNNAAFLTYKHLDPDGNPLQAP